MNVKYGFWILFVPLILAAQTGVSYDDYFIDRTMRIDYYHTGNHEQAWLTLDQIYKEGQWAGSLNHLIDPFNNGNYYVKIYDQKSAKLIYSKGFNSYFGEYQTTAKAKEGVKRTFHESAIIPFPKNRIVFAVHERDRENRLREVFRTVIDPNQTDAIIEEKPDAGVQTFDVVNNGHPHNHVDLAIIAEGYTAKEKNKAIKDFRHFSNILLSKEPFAAHQDKFNIRGVYAPSLQSGCDEPTHGVYKNTVLNTTFNSMGSPRYLLTEDNRNLHDVVAHVPYDALLSMVNQERYGGGGIYNFYLTFTSDSEWRDYVMVHEFGHSFAGLADEYYSSATAYDDFYPKNLEPLEPNITALHDHDDLKWKSLWEDGVPVPTPWPKDAYDSLDAAYQKQRQRLNTEIARMQREGASQESIDIKKIKAAKLSQHIQSRLDSILHNSRYYDRVGAFEGAGYVSDGMYRPMMDCIMFSKGDKPFCKVCRQAIERVIRFYSE